MTQYTLPHVCVCICTCRRPHLLRRTLDSVRDQRNDRRFTLSISIADNDPAASARATVEQFAAETGIPIHYAIEPTPGIAPARNKVLAGAEGDYLALIDDDELASPTWIAALLDACDRFEVDGVFGPVKPHFDLPPPRWLVKSGFCDRRVHPTGTSVAWREARTGNVLLKRAIVRSDVEPFRAQFKIGEDQDLFRRKMQAGMRFIWCAEADVYEVVPPSRWKRSYWLKRGLLRGEGAAQQPDCGTASVFKSCVALLAYSVAAPLLLLAGHHRFMRLLVKICDHMGKILAVAGVHPLRGSYIAE